MIQFPEGSAATNRVYTYAKGLLENNVEIDVICFGNDFVDQTEGVADGILYYPFGQKTPNPSFFNAPLANREKYFNTYFMLRKINRRRRIDVSVRYPCFIWNDT